MCDISNDLEKQWREEGYCVARGLLEPELVTSCADLCARKWPSPDRACREFGSAGGELEFPSGQIFDRVSLHPRLIATAQRLLRTDHVVLIQSDVWSKGGQDKEPEASITDDSPVGADIKDAYSQNRRSVKYSNQDQRMHMDYGNNTFLHPADWDAPEQMAAIVYFADTGLTGGGTAVVARGSGDDPAYAAPYVAMPGQAGHPFINNKAAAEEHFTENDPEVAALRASLYPRERIPRYQVGDVLLYRMDVWHRGTPVRPGCVRSVMNLAWRRGDCPWYATWNPGFCKRMYYGPLERLLVSLTPTQRATIGVPPLGSTYWTKKTIALFKARYPGIDVQPYLDALPSSEESGATDQNKA